VDAVVDGDGPVELLGEERALRDVDPAALDERALPERVSRRTGWPASASWSAIVAPTGPAPVTTWRVGSGVVDMRCSLREISESTAL
jgi:hypothetical protein